MALVDTDLALFATCGRNSIWHYRTADAAASVQQAGYFNDFAASMNIGDIIFLYSGYGGTVAHGVLVVVQNDGSAVDCSNINAWTITDSD